MHRVFDIDRCASEILRSSVLGCAHASILVAEGLLPINRSRDVKRGQCVQAQTVVVVFEREDRPRC